MKARVLVHVQHLLGIGHVRRAALLTTALTEAGAEVTVATGGFPLPGIDFRARRVEQLAPARAASHNFKPILDAEGQPITPEWAAARQAHLCQLVTEVVPHVLVTETYPFGRRAFRHEMLAAIEAAHRARPAVRIVSSIRDILIRKADQRRVDEIIDTVNAHYHAILVHGDPDILPLQASFAEATLFADRLRYTGYVTPPRRVASAVDGEDGRDEVVVSVGGGAVGGALLEAAAAARALSVAAGDTRWRLLVGPDVPAAARAALIAAAPDGVLAEPARPDFPDLLARCRVSVSQAGYNTVMDIMTAGCRAVLVPFAAGGRETEQPARAALLAGRGLAQVVEEDGLTPARLAAAVDRAVAASLPERPAMRGDGAQTSASILLDLAAAAGA